MSKQEIKYLIKNRKQKTFQNSDQKQLDTEPTDDNKLKIIESNNKTPLEEHNEFKAELKTRTRARKTLKQLQGI
jgi:hypothetical protein